MRFNYVSMLAFITFLSVVDTVLATSTTKLMLAPELPASVSEFSDTNNGKRNLRADTTVDEDDEERAVARLKIPALEKALNRANQRLVRAWIKKDFEVDDVFVALKLGDVKNNIFTSPKFKTWAHFAIARDQNNAVHEMLMSLMRKYGDIRLAKILQWYDKGSTAPISKIFQKAQFDFWYKEKMGPNYIVRIFFKHDDDTTGS